MNPNTRYEDAEGRAAAMEAFELAERDEWQKTPEILAALRLRPGMRVADIGAGTGYFTRALAAGVAPGGRVWAVDVTPEFLDELRARAAEAGLDNIDTVLSTATDPRLPADSVDLVFFGDAYHHLDQPAPVLRGVGRALRDTGRLAVVDWRRAPNPRFEASGLDWRTHIRLDEAALIQEIQDNGFRLLEQHDVLEWQSFLVFGKRL